MQGEFDQFDSSLGPTSLVKRINAAKSLIADELEILPAEKIFQKLGNRLTVGKLCLLSKLAGEDPAIFKSLKTSQLLASINESNSAEIVLTTSVSDFNLSPGGFTYYARETIIASEFQGSFLMPFKMTSHANIYKILESYDALYDPKQKRGAVLCPIQKQRIQTRSQSKDGSNPVDVRVLAFLANKYPGSFNSLKTDFFSKCKVLTPSEAIKLGTSDNKFVIEDYFPV